MEHAFLHRLGRTLWRSLVLAIVVLAAYVSGGRLLVDAVGDYQGSIIEALNERVPFTIEADSVTGEWRFFSPELVFSGLHLRLAEQPGVTLALGEGRVRVDVLRSLLATSLQVSQVTLEQLDLPLVLDEAGQMHLEGFADGSGELGDWSQQLVLNIQQLQLTDNRLTVRLPNGEQRELTLDLGLQRQGGRRELRGSVRAAATGTRVDLLAHTLGNPFDLDAAEGDAYLRVTNADLAALESWLPPRERQAALRGRVDLELWLSLGDGAPQLETRVSGRKLNVVATDGSWDFPLDQLDFTAALKRRDNSWSLFTRDLSLVRGETVLAVPRLQLDLWGDSLRLRGEGLPLEPVSALYADFPATPGPLAEALHVLGPGARLPRVEFSLDDIRAPGRGWQLAANFNQFTVQSWRGAPGMDNARGFVRLAPGNGQVILDSRQFSMTFPTVYAHPLDYDALYGTVDIAWDEEALTLHSGPVFARGEEGESRALFGLRVPFAQEPAGIEMDLLVGLRDSNAGYRDKYLPAVLDERLLNWLRGSLSRGSVEQGAFLWRGSLRADAADLRTVQLFFDVSDTDVAYQPDWPPLSDMTGLVLIDDTDVSVWADRARLYESRLERVSAEAWKAADGDMRLAVTANMTGPAADGLRLVEASPLADLTGHVFDDWSLDGELRTRLALELELSDDAPPPRVSVSAVLDDAHMETGTLGLVLEDVAGEVDYDSGSGFRSRGLRGKLWQQPITATLSRETPEPDDGDTGTGTVNALRIDLAGEVPAEPLQDWLGLPGPGPASGAAAVDGTLRVVPGQPATLHLASMLEGLALDLPPPLGKSAAQARSLVLDLALAGDPRRLDLSLGRQMQLALLLGAGNRVTGGTVALQGAAGEPAPGALRFSGELSRLDIRQWQSTLESLGGSSGESLGESVNQGAQHWPPVTVDDLLVKNLLLGDIQLDEVMLNGQLDTAGRLKVAAETDWFSGDLRLAPGLERGSLALSHLELRGLSHLGGAGDRAGGPADVPTQLPDLDVDIASITRDGRPFGRLHFTLENSPWALRAADITGEISGLQLGAKAPGELLWRRGPMRRSSFSARLDFEDLGGVLQQLGYERILDTEAGHLDLQLDWPGGPQNFSLVETRGRLGIDVDGGRFLDASAGTSGTLRVVSILNLAEIVQSLSLNHMFESGIPFDDVDGEVFFHAGTIEVPSLAVKGASSSFTFSGVSPVRERSLDGELVATLPVASNLPWVAALTAGLPVAAGVYVVSKVFEQQFNRMSSAVYRVEGSWDDPEVSFSRIFDTGGKRSSDEEESGEGRENR